MDLSAPFLITNDQLIVIKKMRHQPNQIPVLVVWRLRLATPAATAAPVPPRANGVMIHGHSPQPSPSSLSLCPPEARASS